jgi:ABC-type nitrate/sulfonate/bicarbonate transport system substrate-binding protein
MKAARAKLGRLQVSPKGKEVAAKVRYGQVQRSAMNWPFYVAEALDLFAEQELVVESKVFTLPPDPVAALIDGAMDIINVIPDVALAEMVEGAPLVIIANTNDRPRYRLMAQPEIQDCRQLEGKKIGVNDVRSAEALILERLLRKKGLRPDSYEPVAAGPPPQRCEKLKQGIVNATMVSQPFDFLLEEEGFAFLGSSLEVVPDYPFTVCVARKGKEINEKLVAFLKALKKSWDWLADPAHYAQALRILAHATQTSERQAERPYELYLNPASPPSLAPREEGVAAVLDLLAESRQLPLPLPPPRRYIDERYFQRLEATGEVKSKKLKGKSFAFLLLPFAFFLL